MGAKLQQVSLGKIFKFAVVLLVTQFLASCFQKESVISAPLLNSGKALSEVSDVLPGEWDYICYATESARFSWVIDRADLKWVGQIAIEQGVDFIADGETYIALVDAVGEQVDFHQVNTRTLRIAPNYWNSNNCFDFHEAQFKFIEEDFGWDVKIYIIQPLLSDRNASKPSKYKNRGDVEK